MTFIKLLNYWVVYHHTFYSERIDSWASVLQISLMLFYLKVQLFENILQLLDIYRFAQDFVHPGV